MTRQSRVVEKKMAVIGRNGVKEGNFQEIRDPGVSMVG